METALALDNRTDPAALGRWHRIGEDTSGRCPLTLGEIMKAALPVAAAIACLISLTGCSSPEANTPSPTPSASAEPSPSPEETTAAPATPSPTPAATTTSPPTEQPTAQLTETFASEDGALAFRYPAGWTVSETSNEQSSQNTAHRTWEVTDPTGQITLRLSISAGIAPIGSAPLTAILPQGPIPGASEHVAKGVRAVVAASPGQALGANGFLFFGMAADSGGDTFMFHLPWGPNHHLYFTGTKELGPSDQLDLGAEAVKFAEDPQFRTEILPMIQSLTAAAPPPWGRTSSIPAAPAVGECVGAKYTYQNLQGVSCDEAKSILQTVLDTGEPFGARSQVTPEYECYESSYVEQTNGLPLITCWALTPDGQRGHVVLEANSR